MYYLDLANSGNNLQWALECRFPTDYRHGGLTAGNLGTLGIGQTSLREGTSVPSLRDLLP
jgi:hypothetical protein